VPKAYGSGGDFVIERLCPFEHVAYAASVDKHSLDSGAGGEGGQALTRTSRHPGHGAELGRPSCHTACAPERHTRADESSDGEGSVEGEAAPGEIRVVEERLGPNLRTGGDETSTGGDLAERGRKRHQPQACSTCERGGDERNHQKRGGDDRQYDRDAIGQIGDGPQALVVDVGRLLDPIADPAADAAQQALVVDSDFAGVLELGDGLGFGCLPLLADPLDGGSGGG
jgi:hypothetical protein